jgi:ABC-type antimicrobial peptide transport system permease subunit
MASATSQVLARQHGLRLLPAITKLAGWRFKQMWRFLFVTWLGMLAMVVLICAPPLFSRVAISADLRNAAASSLDGQNIQVNVVSTSPTTQQMQQISQQLALLLKQSGFSAYTQGQSQFVIQTPPLSLVSSSGTPSDGNTKTASEGNSNSNEIVLDGYDPALAAQHVIVVQGRLPQVTSDGSIEIALTQDVATTLGLHVGSVIQGRYPVTLDSQLHLWNLHVVGIVAPQSAHDLFHAKLINPFGTSLTQKGGETAYSVLAASQTVSAQSASLQVASEPDATRLVWSYPFNVAQLDANNISELSQQAANLQQNINHTLSNISGVAIAFPIGSLFNTLSTYNQQIVVLEIVLVFLLLIILAIVLFLVSMMSGILVEQQETIIAMLRSRGATRRHIFGAFMTQGFVLGLLALLAGPFLSLLLVRLIAQTLLPPADQQALSVITTQPVQAVLDVKWYALAAIIVGLFVMIISVRQATRLDIVALRRASSRAKHTSLWRRLNLDYLLVLLITAGYIAYIYFWNVLSTSQNADPTLYNIMQALAFIAPQLLVAALIMLFLRLFPYIQCLMTSMAIRSRGATAVLAFAQMQRTPRDAIRTIVLLILAVSSSCFLLTLIATKDARTVSAANFAVGADFTGAIPAADANKPLGTLQQHYSQVPGVTSVTLGYSTDIDTTVGVIHLEAVDASTYANSALWTTQNSAQPLSQLTTQLVSHRTDATAHNVVYALVDSAMWQYYHLSPGEQFSLQVDATNSIHINFIALAEVNTIPGMDDTPVNPSNGVGLLVDYQSYASVYAKVSGTSLPLNMMWLHTKSDAASLASVRHTFPDLTDRRQLIINGQENSIHLDIIGVLTIGIGATLVLALIGTLLSSWLNAASRRTSFAVMRALGMAPPQISAVLLWEQLFIYGIAFLLGSGLGALLINFVAPSVSLLDLAGPEGGGNPYDVPAVLTTIPYQQLLLVVGVMAAFCLAALLFMARVVSRPSVGTTLRMNED